MVASYDPTQSSGRVRLLIGDTDVDDADVLIFSDAEIETFLDLEDGSVYRAAAVALETIATQETLILKVMTLLDLQTDGAAVGRELRQRAQRLREQADAADARDGAMFDWAEQVNDAFGARERIVKQALRGQI